MRLREPFNGYKLSSGHFMFHMAYLVGSNISVRGLLDPDQVADAHIDYMNDRVLYGKDVLF